MPDSWFLPAPITLPSSRIDGTLGLRRALRTSHERVVPGIGGLRFVRQASWACAAIDLARAHQHPTSTNSRVANALEALACKLVFYSGGPAEEEASRVRGITRLGINHGEPGQWAYSHLREPKHYVSQPFRQSTTASLTHDAGLGLVAAGPMRFNAMQLSERGNDLANAFLDQRASRSYLRTVLTKWLAALTPQASGNTVLAVRDALLSVMRPGQASAQERATVRRCLTSALNKQQADQLMGDDQRRARLHDWMADLGQQASRITIDDLERQLKSERTTAADAHWVACEENFYLERFMHAARAVLVALIDTFQAGPHMRTLPALVALDAVHAACAGYAAAGAAYSRFIHAHPSLGTAALSLDPTQSEPQRVVEQIAAQAPLLLRRDGDKLVAGILMRSPPSVEIDRALLEQRDMRHGQWLPRRIRQLQGLTVECLDA